MVCICVKQYTEYFKLIDVMVKAILTNMELTYGAQNSLNQLKRYT